MKWRRYWPVTSVLLVGMAVYFGFRGGEEEQNPAPPVNSIGKGRRLLDSQLGRARSSEEVGKSMAAEREKILEELKERWLVLKPLGNAGIKEQSELAEECARRLLCHEEVVTLLVWLKANRLWGAGKLQSALESRLKASGAENLREMLTRLPELPSESGRDGFVVIQQLCNAAGQGCPQKILRCSL